MNLTKENWLNIETQLSGSFGQVELLCDGYKISAQVQRKTALKYVIAVYVNGSIKGEWYKGEAEEPKKFHCAKKHFTYKASSRSEAAKKLKSRRLHASLKDHYKHVVESATTLWYPYWTSPKAFCSHIRKTCSTIEIVKIGF